MKNKLILSCEHKEVAVRFLKKKFFSHVNAS